MGRPAACRSAGRQRFGICARVRRAATDEGARRSAQTGHRSPPGCRGGVRPRFPNRLRTGTLRRERIGKVHDHEPESSRVDNPGGGANLRSRCFQPQQDQPLQRNPRFHRIRGKEETAGRRYPGDQGGVWGRVWGGVGVRPRTRPGIWSGMPAVAEFFVPELVMLGLGNQRQRRRQDAGISRPGNFHEAAGEPGKTPLREFPVRRRFLDPGGRDSAESGVPGKASERPPDGMVDGTGDRTGARVCCITVFSRRTSGSTGRSHGGRSHGGIQRSWRRNSTTLPRIRQDPGGGRSVSKSGFSGRSSIPSCPR